MLFHFIAMKCPKHEVYFIDTTSDHAFIIKQRLMVLPYCTYILLSLKDLKLYIGFSSNLVNRIKDHNNGNTVSTKGRRPLQLIYCEFHISKKDAMRRESYFKTTAGKKAIKLMLRESLDRLDYKGRQ